MSKLSKPGYFYSEEDEKKIREMHADYYSVEEIAAKIGKRDPNRILQKIFRMGLPKRDVHTVRLVAKHGRDVLAYGTNHKLILAGLERHRKIELAAAKARKLKVSNEAIKRMKKELAQGEARNIAIKRAAMRGANYSDIGKVVGLTKQGVSWVVNSIRGLVNP